MYSLYSTPCFYASFTKQIKSPWAAWKTNNMVVTDTICNI